MGKNVEKREPSYTAGGIANSYSHYGKQYGVSPKNRIDLPYNLAIPFLGIYLKVLKIYIKTIFENRYLMQHYSWD